MPTASPNTAFVTTLGLLGGESVLHANPRVDTDWIPLVRRGLPSASLDLIVRFMGITQNELAHALAIPERTLARRKREGTLDPEESAKLVRLANIVERAQILFEDTDNALNWLQQPNAALGGVTPLSLLDTDIGAHAVLDTLGRIEHGVFA